MTWFQIITISVAAVLSARALIKLARALGRRARMTQGFLALMWAAAIIFILRPDWMQHAADILGIGRGTDLVLYGLVFAFLVLIGSLYYRLRELRREITVIVRHIAMHEADAPVKGSQSSWRRSDERDEHVR